LTIFFLSILATGTMGGDILLTCQYGVITIQNVFIMRIRASSSALTMIQDDCDKHTTIKRTPRGAQQSTCSVNFGRFLKTDLSPEEAADIIYTCSIPPSVTENPWLGLELESESSEHLECKNRFFPQEIIL